jgi:hypothetical protein
MLYGTDIDSRSRRPSDTPERAKSYIHPLTDCVKLFPLLAGIEFKVPHVLLNPPFSLRWPTADIAPHLSDELGAVLKAHTNKDGTADSTLLSILITLTLLTQDGEALIICNGDTAKRLYATTPVLHGYTWFQLTIDHPIFENQLTPFPTACLYLSNSHRAALDPHMETTPHAEKITTSPLADDITKALLPVTQRKSQYHYGHTPSAYYHDQHTENRWNATIAELKELTTRTKPRYNISLSADGLLSTYLSSYNTLRFSANDITALKILHSINGRHPASLVVQTATRRTLVSAVNGGIWTVEPKVIDVVNRAVDEYNAVRAPFYTPSPIQCLAYLDEEDTIRCTHGGLIGIHPGDKCAISTRTETTKTPSVRYNTAGEKEDTVLHALDLVITIKSACDQYTHEFVISHNPDHHQDGEKTYYHPVQRLIEHFHIPRPASVSETNPGQYQKNLDAMDRIEALINQPALSA